MAQTVQAHVVGIEHLGGQRVADDHAVGELPLHARPLGLTQAMVDQQ